MLLTQRVLFLRLGQRLLQYKSSKFIFHQLQAAVLLAQLLQESALGFQRGFQNALLDHV